MLDSGCAGFPLGYPSRSDIDINTKYTYLVQDRRPDASVCQPGRQNIPGNNPFPIANVVPGQQLHLTWQPDGHLDDARPSTIEVHWAGVPGKQLHTRAELGPATLLGTMIFGTSANCDQPSEPNTWCHGHITVPQGTQPGTYQLIWWWKYDRNPHGEEYSTCFEISVNGDGSAIQSREVDAEKTITQVVETAPPVVQEVEPESIDNASEQNQAPIAVEVATSEAPAPKDVAPAPEAVAPVISGDIASASLVIPEAIVPVVPETAAPLQVVSQQPAQVQAEVQQPAAQDIIVKTEPLHLAYMTKDPSTLASDSGLSAADNANPPNVETLADLSTKADQPLNVIPNISIIRDSRTKDQNQVDGFDSDELGSLAGDAVNDSEGKDTSPLPLAKPSELVNNALSETASNNNDSANANVNRTTPLTEGTNSTSTVTPSGEKASNTVAAIPAFRPSTDASSAKDKERDNSLGRNLAGQVPKTADSASGAATHQFMTTAALVSTALATFTWMLA
ncbi:hypothetical protein EC991_002609 [Linnemannia zychae]|nr:hypothetical protein EC991_002609 [Linnemannia zychae]